MIDKIKSVISFVGCKANLINNKIKRVNQEFKCEFSSVAPLSGPIKRKGCIFIHIPKAAGTSLSLTLYGYQVGHRKYRDIYAANKKQVEMLFSFTVVRHPIDRFISAYKFLTTGGMNEGDAKYKREVIDKYSDINDFISNGNIDDLMEKVHFQPQYTFICDSNGYPMVDYIGRYEKLDEVAVFLSKVLGEKIEIPIINKTKELSNCNEQFKLTESSRLKLQSIYEKDFAMFGYGVERI